MSVSRVIEKRESALMLKFRYIKLLLTFAINCNAHVFFCWKCDAKNKLECNRIGELEKVRAFEVCRQNLSKRDFLITGFICKTIFVCQDRINNCRFKFKLSFKLKIEKLYFNF